MTRTRTRTRTRARLARALGCLTLGCLTLGCLTLGCLTLVVTACSDDSSPATDSGPQVEHPKLGDGTHPILDGRSPDLAPGICDPSCLAADLSLCVKSPSEGRCVECLEDKHCTGNPGALGTRCDKARGFCICDEDKECQGNLRGPFCDHENQICTCKQDGDCKAPFDICVGGDLHTCRPPCKSNADCGTYPTCDLGTGKCITCKSDGDCFKNALAKHCDTIIGQCVACTSDAHCGPGAPRCSKGSCVECKAPSDCATSPNGSACNQNRCTCNGAAECATAAWGKKCLTGLAWQRCGCSANADCAGAPAGATCYQPLGWCSCASDAECTAQPLTRCAFPSDLAEYQQCQQPCSGDPDCQQRSWNGVNAGLKHCSDGRCVTCTADADCTADPARKLCQTSLGRCVACKTGADCGGLTPLCDAASGTCVECLGSPDCAAHPNGSVCSNQRCGCAGDPDCAAVTSWGKKCLPAGSQQRCGCAADGECAGQATGPTCYTTFQKCSCSSNAQCTQAPWSSCGLPYAGAGYQYCQKPCTGDPECLHLPGLKKCSGGRCVACTADTDCSAGKPYCSSALGLCVGCKTGADCSKEEWAKLCDPGSGCVECVASSDCTVDTLGKTCSKGSCVCASDPDCAANLSGKRCSADVKACTCSTDGDCLPPRKCTGVFLSAKICE